MLAYEPVLKAAKEYAGNPAPFLYAIILRFFMVAVTGFTVVAVLLATLLVIDSVSQLKPYALPLFSAVAAICLFIFFYFWSGFKGSMINSFLNAEAGEVHMRDYLHFSFLNAPRFFEIFLVKNFFLFLVTVPAILLLVFLKIELVSLPGAILVAIAVVLGMLVKYLFSFSYIIAVVKNVSALSAFRNNFRFIAKNLLTSFALYIFYMITVCLLMIPGLNIFILLSLYPMTYVMTINTYRAAHGV